MLVKGSAGTSSRRSALPLALLLGVALGVLVAPFAVDGVPHLQPASVVRHKVGKSEGPVAPAALPPAATGELPTLQINVGEADWQVLAAARERALAQGIIVQNADEVVPVAVTFGSETGHGTVRLKGDWTDHVDTDQWSLRFELQHPVGGMRRFSIEHPKTRGFVMEWLTMETARREGVLAPRCQYVRATINGVAKGVYFLEEHFSKELLEAQSRREGPIVKFDESGMWSTWLQHGFNRTHVLSPDVLSATWFTSAVADAFSEARMEKGGALNRRLLRALEQARDLQRLAVAETAPEQVRRLQALARLEGRTVDDLFAADKLGKWLAVYTLFRGFHGLAWHQLRMYHDPVLDRLEPIVFDTGADFLSNAGKLALSSPEIHWLTTSDAAMAAAFAELGRMTEPQWLAALIADLAPRLRQIAGVLTEAGIVLPGVDINLLLSDVLPQQVAALREIVRPVVAATFVATEVAVSAPPDEQLKVIDVDAAATTAIPTQVLGFRFSNGRFVGAAEALVGLTGLPDSADGLARSQDGGVLLPRDGSLVRFRFPLDRRLAQLAAVKAMKSSRRHLGVVQDDRVKVKVLYRTMAETENRSADLQLRRLERPDLDLVGRPPAPTLAEALQQYPCLTYDLATDQLLVQPGRHELAGDLVLPADRAIYLPAGAELRFRRGAVLVAAAMFAEGTAEQPVILGPSDQQAGWSGVQIVGGAGPSRLRHVQVSGATAIDRGGWQSSGGLTCYRSPAEFYDCRFLDARCEDSVNLIGIHFHMERCEFDGGHSDLLDGDFVRGEVVDTVFKNSGEDAIDMSGSNIDVRGCTFENIGDKCVSAGEVSTIHVANGRVVSTSIGIASKDRSDVTVEGFDVAAVDHYVFAVYVKKAEFGAAKMQVQGLQWRGAGQPPLLAQTGCALRVNGLDVAPQPVDVAEQYRLKILGK